MPIRIPFPSPSHVRTKYIELDRSKCQACWECVETCPNHVLGKVIVFNHRHARVDHAEACKGCKKCVRSCPNDAIRYTYVPPRRRVLAPD
jgi:ferredoxin